MVQINQAAKIAVINIITYNTLPSQIDYVEPYKRAMLQAEAFLNTLPQEEKDAAWAEINITIDAYYEEDENGISQDYLDSLF